MLDYGKMNETAQLAERLNIYAIQTFGIEFENVLQLRMKQPDINKTVGALLVDIVKELLEKARYAHVLEAYKRKDTAVKGYTPRCSQALDLYIASSREK